MSAAELQMVIGASVDSIRQQDTAKVEISGASIHRDHAGPFFRASCRVLVASARQRLASQGLP
jgi:hypothetical protein